MKNKKKKLSPAEIAYLKQYGWGGGLSGAATGAATGAMVGSVIPVWGTAVGAVVGGVAGGITGHLKEERQLEAQARQENMVKAKVANQDFWNDTTTQSLGVWGARNYADGGPMPQQNMNGIIQSYAGQSHQGPQGGIPVDQMGRPSAVSNSGPIAKVEDGEVSWNGYIFSDRLKGKSKKTFAAEAKKVLSKYKKRLGDNFEHDDSMSSEAMNAELEMIAKENEAVRIAKEGAGTGDKFANGGPAAMGPPTQGQAAWQNFAEGFADFNNSEGLQAGVGALGMVGKMGEEYMQQEFDANSQKLDAYARANNVLADGGNLPQYADGGGREQEIAQVKAAAEQKIAEAKAQGINVNSPEWMKELDTWLTSITPQWMKEMIPNPGVKQSKEFTDQYNSDFYKNYDKSPTYLDMAFGNKDQVRDYDMWGNRVNSLSQMLGLSVAPVNAVGQLSFNAVAPLTLDPLAQGLDAAVNNTFGTEFDSRGFLNDKMGVEQFPDWEGDAYWNKLKDITLRNTPFTKQAGQHFQDILNEPSVEAAEFMVAALTSGAAGKVSSKLIKAIKKGLPKFKAKVKSDPTFQPKLAAAKQQGALKEGIPSVTQNQSGFKLSETPQLKSGNAGALPPAPKTTSTYPMGDGSIPSPKLTQGNAGALPSPRSTSTYPMGQGNHPALGTSQTGLVPSNAGYGPEFWTGFGKNPNPGGLARTGQLGPRWHQPKKGIDQPFTPYEDVTGAPMSLSPVAKTPTTLSPVGAKGIKPVSPRIQEGFDMPMLPEMPAIHGTPPPRFPFTQDFYGRRGDQTQDPIETQVPVIPNDVNGDILPQPGTSQGDPNIGDDTIDNTDEGSKKSIMKKPFDYKHNIMGYLPGAVNTVRGLFGKADSMNTGPYMQDKISPRRYRTDEAEKSAETAAYNRLRAYNPSSPTANAAQRIASDVALQGQIAGIKERGFNINEQMAQRADTVNAGIDSRNIQTAMGIRDINDRNLAAKDNLATVGLSQLSQEAAGQRQERNTQEMLYNTYRDYFTVDNTQAPPPEDAMRQDPSQAENPYDSFTTEERFNKAINQEFDMGDEGYIDDIPENIIPKEEYAGIDNTIDNIINAESAGDPDAKNPNSSATGLGQFIDSTWMDMMENHPELTEGKTNEEILEMRNNPDISRQITKEYAIKNIEYLKRNNIEPTPGNIYATHHLGPNGAKKILTAPDGDRIKKHVSDSVYNSNPWMHKKTIAEAKEWLENKAQGGTA